MSCNRCETDCDCGVPLEPRESPAAELMTDAEYAEASPGKARHLAIHGPVWAVLGQEFRFRQITCPFCGRQYAGWYVESDDPSDDSEVWELRDSSFFESFRDEPAESDDPTYGI